MYTFMDSFQKIDSNTNSNLPTHGSLSTGCRDFMNDREVNPKKYIAPKSWYKYGSETVRPYKIRIHPPYTKDEKKLRRCYESKLAAMLFFAFSIPSIDKGKTVSALVNRWNGRRNEIVLAE